MISYGVVLSVLFGHWGDAHRVLLILMCIDYITGVGIALLGKSRKTDGGGFSSYTSWRGLVRKILTLLLVAAAHQADIALNTDYIASIVIYGLIANELLSIVENYALSGAKVPQIFYKAIELLKAKGEDDENSDTRRT